MGQEVLFEEFRGSSIVNVATVPLRSPFRYPGGKTWLVPRIRQWLRCRPVRFRELIEPFAGGGIVGLTAVFEDLVDRVTLVELDADIAAVWRVILNGSGEQLIKAIAAFDLSPASIRAALAEREESLVNRAFATLLRNRISRGGILAPGAGVVKRGENDRGLTSRWYPETLQKRIRDIMARRDRICFIEGDGLAVMAENADRADVAFFVDPPYTLAGRRLYTHSHIDHEALFDLAERLSGDFLMTYDDAEEIRCLAERHGFHTRLVPMKNTHHTRKRELLMGRDLDWIE